MRLLIGHLRSGDIVAELDGQADYTDELSAAGSARATLDLDAVPAEIDIRAVTAPWRHYLAITEAATVLWAGPIIPRRRQPGAGQVEIAAAGLWAVFDHRVLARLGDWDYIDPRADVLLTFRSLPGIALDIVQAAMRRPHGELPLVLPQLNTAGDEQRSYFGHELASAGQRLTQLTQTDNGPDLHFQPRYRADHAGIEWAVRAGQPLLTQKGADWHFDDGGNLLGYGWDDDGSVLASTVLVPGDGVERGRLIGKAGNDALQQVGWPALDLVISDHTSEKQQSTLDAHARAYMAAYRTGITRDTAVVHARQPPALGSYLPGDHIVLTPQPDRATPAGQRRRRITAITYRAATPDAVELALAPEATTL